MTAAPRVRHESVAPTRELSRRSYEVARFRLSVVRGVDAGHVLDSGGVELTVGTAEGNDLVLRDPAVSGHHCVFTVGPRGIELRDLDSTNGTFLGRYRVSSAHLVPGAVVTVGETMLRFDALSDRIAEPVSRENRFGPVLGNSMAMRRLFAILERVAPSDATLLIEGETGTGKGLLAEAIHERSPRAQGPFVVIDCASIPPQLMESELFGHEKGSFTGAKEGRVGLFEMANGGTVFLDEIGELPLELQPKLLRVLERRVIRRLGSQRPQLVDVRIIAATNRDLRREVNAGTFRSDLWYRLNTVRVVVPPLRERREDIPMLVAHFYRQMADNPDSRPPLELVQAMRQAAWRGNVRELASAVERSLVFTDPSNWDQVVGDGGEHLAGERSMSFRAAKLRATEEWERQYLRDLIGYYDGNLSRAARAVRMDRSHLRSLLRRYDIEYRATDG